MSYVDGYVLAVPRKNKSDYIRLAEISADVFKDHGAWLALPCISAIMLHR